LSSAPTSPPPDGLPPRKPAAAKPDRPPRICNVATKCVSREDFLRSFAPFVEDTTLFIPTKLAFELGQLVRFQVALADGTVVLAGVGEASELLTGPTGPLGKSGVRFTIKEIDEPSRALRDELASRRRRALAAGVAGAGVEGAEKARMTKTMHGPAANLRTAPRPTEVPPPREPAPTTRPLAEIRPALLNTAAISDAPIGEAKTEPRPLPGPLPSSPPRPGDRGFLTEPSFEAVEPLEGEHTREDVRATDIRSSDDDMETRPGRPLRAGGVDPPGMGQLGRQATVFSIPPRDGPAAPAQEPGLAPSGREPASAAAFARDSAAQLGLARDPAPAPMAREPLALSRESTAPAASLVREWGGQAAPMREPAPAPVAFARESPAQASAARDAVPPLPPREPPPVPPPRDQQGAPVFELDPYPHVPPARDAHPHPPPQREGHPRASGQRPSARHAASAREPIPPVGERGLRGRRVAPFVLAGAAGLLIAFFAWMRFNRTPEPAPSATTLVAAPTPAAPEVEPAPVAAAPQRPAQPAAESMPAARPAAPAARPPAAAPPPAAEPATPRAQAAAGPRNCQARIESKPPGAVVMLGPQTLGRTPLARAAVPCGEASVTITHPRYLPASVALDATPNAPVSVSARLSRPVGQLQLSSSPDGAIFRVNGERVGRGPRNVTVSRFESVRVEARLPGQRPWKRKIYLKDPVTQIEATFE
jgi:hypothetical protein